MTTVPSDIVITILRQRMAQGGTARLKVTSNSMAPLLVAGDEIELSPCNELVAGTIITFVSAGTLQTHRIWGQQPTGWLTRGDYLLQFDQPVANEAIVGQITGRWRNGRYLAFAYGPGQWLTHHAWRTVYAQWRLLVGRQVSLGTPLPDNWTRRFYPRFLRRIVYFWLGGITAVVNQFAVKI